MEPCPAHWNIFLEACLPHLSLNSLVRISICSKAVGRFIGIRLTDGELALARRVLRSVLQEAAHQQSCRDQAEKQQKAVGWLLAVAKMTPDLLQQEDYVNISRVPLYICEQLVAAGMKVTYSQLLSAARNRVEQLGNWVSAYRQQRVLSGLNPMVEIACRPELLPCSGTTKQEAATVEVLLRTMPPHSIEDTLILAINSIGSTLNESRLEYRRTSMGLQLVLVLLSLPLVAAELTAEACTRLLLFLIDLAIERQELLKNQLVWFDFDAVFEDFAKLPRMQHMTDEDACIILDRAISLRLDYKLRRIPLDNVIQLPCVQQLSGDSVLCQIKTAIQALQAVEEVDLVNEVNFYCYLIGWLGAVPSATTVPAEAWTQLYHLCFDTHHRCWWFDHAVSQCILSLPGVLQLGITAVQELRQSVVLTTI